MKNFPVLNNCILLLIFSFNFVNMCVYEKLVGKVAERARKNERVRLCQKSIDHACIPMDGKKLHRVFL